MKIQLSLSGTVPTPPELFARLISQRAGLSGIKTSKRGTKYTAKQHRCSLSQPRRQLQLG